VNTSDDAAVYRVRDDLAIAITVDYFTPIVDDPWDFGEIAVANALSDCYAMGVQPSIALNIVGFPTQTLPLFVLDQILAGGSQKAREAGITIVGGHTVDDPEPKYGMAVVGFTHPDAVIANAGALKGDALVLTKPLGVGIITSAIKVQAIPPEQSQRAIDLMKTLNRDASRVMAEVGVHACTDVTGFGLLGHLWEMTSSSSVGAEIFVSQIPVLSEAWSLAEEGVIPAGAFSNREFVANDVTFDKQVSDEAQLILCDPQTSGGLLMAVAPEKTEHLLRCLEGAGISAAVIGCITPDLPGRIRVSP